MSSEEAYNILRGRPDASNTTLDLLGRAGDRGIQQTQALSEENAQHQRDMYNNANAALQTGVKQYDKSYDRSYQGARDAQSQGRLQEAHGAAMEEANRKNRMAGAEESYLNTPDASGAPRWQQERQEDRKFKRDEQALNNQSVRSGIAMTNAQMKQMQVENERAQEQHDIGQAATSYGQALQQPPQFRDKALAQVDAQYPKLSLNARQTAKAQGMGQVKSATASQDLLVGSSPEGQQASEKLGALDMKLGHLASIKNDINEFKQATPYTPEEDAAMDRVAAKLEAIQPGSAKILSMPANPLTGTKSARMSTAIAGLETNLRGEAQRLQSQYGSLNSSQIQGQIQRINTALNDLQTMRMGLGKNNMIMTGAGNTGANGMFLRGNGMQQMPPQGMPPPPPGGHGQQLSISFQGAGPQVQAPTMRPQP